MFSISAISQSKASEAGGTLDGFKATCTCGMVLKSSLLNCLRHDIAAHAAYHSKRNV